MIRPRGILAALYVLATLVAQVGHDHGHAHHAEAPAALASCADGGVHLADHPDAPDLGHADAGCPACLVRSNPAQPASAVSLAGTSTGCPVPFPTDLARPAAVGGPSRVRAPPLA